MKNLPIKKWLFGGLGFVLGGYLGALLGFVIGNLADMATDPTSHPFTGRPTGWGYRKVAVSDIKMSILVLIACVIKADGKILKSEINFIKPFLRSNYGEDAQEALHILKGLLSQDIDIQAAATQIGQNVNYSTKLGLMHLLVDLANADDVFSPSEKTTLSRIAFYMQIDEADFRSLCSIYTNKQNANWAYDVLEISPNASDEEVKKAYRRMSMKYHPDKVADGGEEMIKRANEKFDSVRKAYTQIKSQRNLK